MYTLYDYVDLYYAGDPWAAMNRKQQETLLLDEIERVNGLELVPRQAVVQPSRHCCEHHPPAVTPAGAKKEAVRGLQNRAVLEGTEAKKTLLKIIEAGVPLASGKTSYHLDEITNDQKRNIAANEVVSLCVALAYQIFGREFWSAVFVYLARPCN